MKILAIDTSCDETSIAIIEAKKRKNLSLSVLANIVSSQIKIHKKWGGVYPTLAKREHQKNLILVFKKALKKAQLLKKSKKIDQNSKIKVLKRILKREKNLCQELIDFLKKYKKPKIDLIAITQGPGLEPCLWVGINFARALAYYWKLPLIPINHIEAHILVSFLNKLKGSRSKLQDTFPAVCLIVSGGHTQLILMRDFGKYKILGETRDDAAGECFDKAARILGLDYPGGPAIAKLASQHSPKTSEDRVSISLPRPMINSKNYDFSFSGLKTAVLYKWQEINKKRLSWQNRKKIIKKMSVEIQQAIIDVLIKKTLKAAKDFKTKTIILGGGVAANKELRKQIKEKIKKDLPGVSCLIPQIKFCTDNAVMIGIAAYFKEKKQRRKNWKHIKADANLKIC